MRISDWSSDVCSSDLDGRSYAKRRRLDARLGLAMLARLDRMAETRAQAGEEMLAQIIAGDWPGFLSLFDAAAAAHDAERTEDQPDRHPEGLAAALALWLAARDDRANRSEEHTSELQSLMRISYAVFCLKKKKTTLCVPIPHTTLL